MTPMKRYNSGKSSVGLWLYWPILISIAGCVAPERTVGLAELEDPNPAVRVRAIKWAGANNISAAVPLLVDRLVEQDKSVRFFAIKALRDITGKDHGYDYRADDASRARAVARWRKAIDKQTMKQQPAADDMYNN